jgi:hypothetical protein
MRLRTLSLVLALGLAACTTVREHLPWRQRSAPPPPAVHELQVVVPPDAQVPIVLQFWERNTLVVDITGVASEGSVTLKAGDSGRWPARLAVRFEPGRFEAVEIRGAQRVVYPVTSDRKGPATVDVPPAAVPPATGSITLAWGAKAAF